MLQLSLPVENQKIDSRRHYMHSINIAAVTLTLTTDCEKSVGNVQEAVMI
jgi:hypothetical protein